MSHLESFFFYFFLNDRAPTEIYPLSLHDALPIWSLFPSAPQSGPLGACRGTRTSQHKPEKLTCGSGRDMSTVKSWLFHHKSLLAQQLTWCGSRGGKEKAGLQIDRLRSSVRTVLLPQISH